ncbi:response regulator [Streptomyces sp. ISL-94]|uniref:response regulator transcription factor n=1 Tax=Streptomyces sp. ISL-94 TaxID=2819190 RepID=UPI0027E55DB6|nr:response regulator [Streptomyces sp. ISL-94]
MTAKVIRVVIADGEPLIRAGIRMILTSAQDIEAVAEAANGREAVELARAHAPEVVLLDIHAGDGRADRAGGAGARRSGGAGADPDHLRREGERPAGAGAGRRGLC